MARLIPLHEPDVCCVAKGKGHKAYGYGNKVSIAATAQSNAIVGVASPGDNVFDGHALPDALRHSAASRGKEAKAAAQAGRPVPARPKTQAMPPPGGNRTGHRPFESRF